MQRCIGALVLLGTGVGGVLAMRPPQLVRGAIEHEQHERMLRVVTSRDGKPMVLMAQEKQALAVAQATFAVSGREKE